MEQKDNNKTRLSNLQSAQELRGKKSGSKTSGKGGKKKLWLSVILLVVLLAAAFGVYYLSDLIKPEEEPEVAATAAPSTTVKVVSRDAAEVDKLTIAIRGEEPYTLISTASRTDEELAQLIAENTPEGQEPADASSLGSAILMGNSAYPMNETTVSTIMSYASSMTAASLVESNVADLSKYGLADPAITVTMTYRDGTQATWYFGDRLPTSGNYYLVAQGADEVYSVYSRPYDAFNHDRLSLHVVSMTSLFADVTAINNFTITPRDAETILIRYLGEDENTVSISSLIMEKPFQYDVNSDRVTEMMEGIIALTVTSYAGEVSELPDSGLDNPRYAISASDANGNTLNYKVGNFCGTDSVYVQKDDTNAVYLADASTLTFLDNAKPSYLVDQFSNLVYIMRVEELTVTAGDDQYNMAITREPILDAAGNQTYSSSGLAETNDTYYFDGEVITEEEFKALYQVIIGTQVSKINEDYYYEGEVLFSISYKLNTAPYEFTVDYMEYDTDYYAVRRNGVSLFLIKKNKVQSMVDALVAFANGETTETAN